MAILPLTQKVPVVVTFKKLPVDILNTIIKKILLDVDCKALSALGCVDKRLFRVMTDYTARDLAWMNSVD